MNNSNNSIVLKCNNLSKSYTDGTSQIEILSQIELSVNSAELIAIVGNSGSGKSTLLHLLGGLDQPTNGTVYLNNKNIYELTEVERCQLRNQCLGFVYQFHHLLAEFSALENVAMPLLIRGRNTPLEMREKAAHLLSLVGLANRMQHRPSQLSGGERQRVAIARALIVDPLCILADEPTGNLDPYNAEKVLQLFFDLQQKSKASVVMVTHDPVIAESADRVLKIDQGKLIAIE
jgi:lipoprotein-releasing system ATP-binding protein